MMRTYAANDYRPQWERYPVSDNQRKYISDLMKTKGISAEALVAQFPERPRYKDEASKVIDWLKAQPTVSPAPSSPQAPKHNWDDIPDGNYAYEYNGKTHFYRVSRKNGRGQYAGRVFLNVQERASSILYPVDDYKRRAAILHTIRKNGPEACGLLFAERLGKCRFCFEDLTDEDNPYKVRGAGPVCGPKHLG